LSGRCISWFPNAQRDIATICITYLLFSVFETGFCQSDEDFAMRLQRYPFYKYAARYWGKHARAASVGVAASTGVQQLILRFFESEAKLSACRQAMGALRGFHYPRYSQEVPRQMTGIHLAAKFGLNEFRFDFLKNVHDLNAKGSYGRTPLSWAAAHGQEAVVKSLLAEAHIELESRGNHNRTPLSWAAAHGQEVVVKLLLADTNVDLNSVDIYN
jgi:ankyrin repeat protein